MTRTYLVKSAVVVLAVLVTACSSDDAPVPEADERSAIPFRADGSLSFLRGDDEVVRITIEIAKTDSARQRGLMQRTSLPEQSGMLFIFEREEPQGFWMGNTPLGLDLMFVSGDSQIVDIDKYNKPFNPSTIASDAPAKFVVEVAAGFADTYGITESDRITWRRTDEEEEEEEARAAR